MTDQVGMFNVPYQGPLWKERKQCPGTGPHRRPHIAWPGSGFSWSIAYLSTPGQGPNWGHCWRLYASPEQGPRPTRRK